MTLQPLSDLVRDNVRVLEQGHALVSRLSAEAYATAAPDLELASIGCHVRHVLDFYACFAEQSVGGSVDYDRRARDPRTEIDARRAAERFVQAVQAVRAITTDAPLEVRLEGGPWTTSSRARELASLLSHAVHHYALIAILLRRAGEPVDAKFGVAPSTLAHWEESGVRTRP